MEVEVGGEVEVEVEAEVEVEVEVEVWRWRRLGAAVPLLFRVFRLFILCDL